jgi:hypothetical protein
MRPPPIPALPFWEAIAANRSSDACVERRRFVVGGEQRWEAEREESISRVWPDHAFFTAHLPLLSFSRMLVHIYLSLA